MGRQDVSDFRSKDYPFTWDAYVVSFKEGESGPVLGEEILSVPCEVEHVRSTPVLKNLIKITKGEA